MGAIAKWHPDWWKQDVHGSAWDRVKDAMQRDWTQTRHDLGIGGHELNQAVGDTARQIAGTEPMPGPEQSNPPRVIGDWDDAEVPYGYGHAARTQFGDIHPQWTPALEDELGRLWKAGVHGPIDWSVAMPLVRRGYDYESGATTLPGHES